MKVIVKLVMLIVFLGVKSNIMAYYPVSPYAYCQGNPVRFIDPTGMDIAVVNVSDGEHIALLIQDENEKWQYYSVNGDNVYVSGKFFGGRPFNDLGVGNWDTPQDFLNSDYNRDLGEEGVLDKNVNNYDYTEAFVIETSKEQDDIIRQTFVDIVSTEPYSLLNTNCATVVQRSMKKAGISVVNPETKTFRVPDNHSLGLSGFSVTRPNYNKIPSTAFKSIIKMNPNGKHIFKQH